MCMKDTKKWCKRLDNDEMTETYICEKKLMATEAELYPANSDQFILLVEQIAILF